MSLPEVPTPSNRRVRRPGMHRGWSLRSMTPEAMARDIANSLRLDVVYGMPQRDPRSMTQCEVTLALVQQLLAQD